MSLLKSEKQAEFTRLFEKYRLVVYRQAFRMTGSVWYAEEAVQEVFLRVWVYREKLVSIRNMRSWLFIVANHIVFNQLAKLSREKRIVAVCRHNIYTDLSDPMIPFKCRQLLAEAESKLTPRQKQIYHKAHVKGLSKKEIARDLNLSEFTISNHIKTSAFMVRNHILMRLK